MLRLVLSLLAVGSLVTGPIAAFAQDMEDEAEISHSESGAPAAEQSTPGADFNEAVDNAVQDNKSPKATPEPMSPPAKKIAKADSHPNRHPAKSSKKAGKKKAGGKHKKHKHKK